MASLNIITAKSANPWHEITPDNKILSRDREAVQIHNKKYSHLEEKRISLVDYPEPFIGNPNAKIYILLANPGRSSESEKKHSSELKKRALESYIINNLRHNKLEYPFYLLDPKFREWHKGSEWWGKALKGLIEISSYEKIAQEVISVELYGYHSTRFEKGICDKLVSLSSLYSYGLVEKAIKENKIILLPRAVGEWYKKVPALKSYDKCYLIATNRGITFTENTISPFAFKEIKKILR